MAGLDFNNASTIPRTRSAAATRLSPAPAPELNR